MASLEVAVTEGSNFGRRLGFVLAVALVLRMVWTLAIDTQPVTDFAWYFDRAASIAAGQGYSVDGRLTAYWPVGYPAFLGLWFAVLGPSVVLGKILNTVLVVLGIWIAGHLGRRISGRDSVGLAAAAILAIHPSWIAYSTILASEPLYTALTLAGLWFLSHWSRGGRDIALAGVLLGLATLVRPQAIVLPLLAAGAFIWRANPPGAWRVWLRTCAALYLAVGLVQTPWMIRNFDVFGSFVFVSTNGGDNLLIGNHEGAEGRYKNPDDCGLDRTGITDEVERDRLARQAGLAYIRAHPLRTIRRWPAKLQHTFFSGTDAPYWAFQTQRGRLIEPGRDENRAMYLGFRSYSTIITPGIAWFGIVLGVVALWLQSRTGRPAVQPLLIVAVTGLISIVFFGNPRFGFPAIPFLAIAGCLGSVLLFETWRARNQKATESQSS